MKKTEKILSICCILIIISCIVPIIITSAYTVLVADDFSHATGVKIQGEGMLQYFVASLMYARKKYLNWQGTYFSMFIQALLCPLSNYELLKLRLVMISNSVLFFGALLFFVRSWMKVYEGKWFKWTLFIYAGITYLLTAYKPYTEIFYWFSGAASYSFPISVYLIAFGLAIRYQQNKRKMNLVSSIILGIVAGGGSLTVVGAACYLCLLLSLFVLLEEKRIRKENVLLFLSWIVGALFNVIAPGNYLRQKVIDETGLHPVSALFASIKDYEERLRWFVENTDAIGILGIIFLVSIILGENKKIKKNYVIVSLFSLILPIITAFPVELAYAGTNYPDRCIFVLDVMIIIVYVNAAYVLGNCVKNIFRDVKYIYLCCAGILLGVMLLFIKDNYSIRDNNSLYLVQNLRKKTYQDYYNECCDFYKTLECYEGKDVIIKWKDFPETIDTLCCFELSEDANYWVNTGISTYYGLNSIKISMDE